MTNSGVPPKMDVYFMIDVYGKLVVADPTANEPDAWRLQECATSLPVQVERWSIQKNENGGPCETCLTQIREFYKLRGIETKHDFERE